MSIYAQFVSTPKNGVAQVSVANTNRNGTGDLQTVFTAGGGGSRIDELVITAQASTTDGMLRLFISDGTNNRLIQEIPVVASTPSSTIPAWRTEVTFNQGLVLQAGWMLKASTEKAEVFSIIPTLAGDF